MYTVEIDSFPDPHTNASDPFSPRQAPGWAPAVPMENVPLLSWIIGPWGRFRMRRLGLAGRSTRRWVWPQVCTGYFPRHVPPHWLFVLFIYSLGDISSRSSRFLTLSLSSSVYFNLTIVVPVKSIRLRSIQFIKLHHIQSSTPPIPSPHYPYQPEINCNSM